MRSPEAMRGFRSAFVAGKRKAGFRLVHYSVQPNHIHLICEADDEVRLARGLQGLAIRVARRVNAALGRKGKLFNDRYHAKAVTSPRQVRATAVYVLNNTRKHNADRLVSRHLPKNWLDLACTSARHFHGWDGVGHVEPDATSEVAAPETWLMKKGWLPHGRIRPGETPATPRRGARGTRASHG